MQAHRVEATVEPDGSVKITELPFRPGEQVEIIVLPITVPSADDNPYPLRGLTYRYERPTDPVAEDDWEAIQ